MASARNKVREKALARTEAIEPPPEGPALALAAEVFRELLRRPSSSGSALERISDAPLRDALSLLAARLHAARARFPALDSPAGAELRRGLELVLLS